MIEIVKIRLREGGKIQDYDTNQQELKIGARVIVPTPDGLTLGTVVSNPQRLDEEYVKVSFRKIVRPATAEDETPRAAPPAARARGLPLLRRRHRAAAAADEAGRGRVPLRGRQGGLLLHRRGPGRLPPAGQGTGARVPDAHRDAPDRRARRGAHDRRLRDLRPRAVLRELPLRLRADLDPHGQGPGPAAFAREGLRRLRPADVLPRLRGPGLRGVQAGAAQDRREGPGARRRRPGPQVQHLRGRVHRRDRGRGVREGAEEGLEPRAAPRGAAAARRRGGRSRGPAPAPPPAAPGARGGADGRQDRRDRGARGRGQGGAAAGSRRRAPDRPERPKPGGGPASS